MRGIFLCRKMHAACIKKGVTNRGMDNQKDAIGDDTPFARPMDPVDDPECHMVRTMFATAKRQWLQTTEYVVVGGAGMHGLMYIGVLMGLCNHDRDTYVAWSSRVKGLAGASAGALVSFMMACGLDPWQMRREIVLCDLGRVVDHVSQTSMEDMRKMGALTSGKAADDATRELVFRLCGCTETTFRALQARTGRTFIVTVSNADTGRTEYWSHWTKPDMPVWLALRCSSSVPVIFNAHSVHGNSIYDGGISCNIPCHLFPSHATLTLFSFMNYKTTSAMPMPTPTPTSVPTPTQPPSTSKLAEISTLAKMTWMNQQLGPMRAVPMYAVRSVPCIAAGNAVSAYTYNATQSEIDVLICSGLASLHGVLLRNLLIAIVYALTVATARWRVLGATKRLQRTA